MYAIFQGNGHQYKAQENKIIKMQKLPVAVGEKVTFERVLAVQQVLMKQLFLHPVL